MTEQEVKSSRFPKLIVGFFSMLFAGMLYTWSILKLPLEDEFGWTSSQTAFNFTLTMCFFCLGGLIAGKIVKAIKPRFTIMLSAFLTASGFILTSVSTGNLTLLYFSYALLCGLGVGIAYNTIISSVNAWYPDKKGVSSGTMLMGFGLSSLIFGNISSILINMDGFGWRSTYFAIGIALGTVLFLSSFMISTPASDAKLPQPKEKKGAKAEIGGEFTMTEMIRRSSFWKYFTYNLLFVAVGTSVISFASELAVSVGASMALATALVGILAVCNGIGRILAGVFFDNFGRKFTMLTSVLTNVAAASTLLIAVSINSLPLGIIGICLTGLGFGNSPTQGAAFVMEFYGRKNFNQNFGAKTTMLIPASFFATLSNYLLETTGGYQATFIMLVGACIISLCINFTIKKP